MSPIDADIVTARLPEVGRLSIGAEKLGRGPGRPIPTWRATSDDRGALEALAQVALPDGSLVGGEVHQPKRKDAPREWQLITKADAIPVLLMAMPNAREGGGLYSQHMEMWGTTTCLRRCTGGDGPAVLAERVVEGRGEDLTVTPMDPQSCKCRATGQHVADWDCTPTLRVNVVVAGIQSLGVFTMVAHGWNANAEVPGSIEVAAQAVGGYLQLTGAPCLLRNIELETTRRGGAKVKVRGPRIDVQSSIEELVAIGRQHAERAALAPGNTHAQLEAGTPEFTEADGDGTGEVLEGEVVDDGRTLEDAKRMIGEAYKAGGITVKQLTDICKSVTGSDDINAHLAKDEDPAGIADLIVERIHKLVTEAPNGAAHTNPGGEGGGETPKPSGAQRQDPDDETKEDPAPEPHPDQESLEVPA